MTAQEFYVSLRRRLHPKGFRSWIMWQILGALNWNFDHIITPAAYPSTRDAFGRRIEYLLERLYDRLYYGSADEIMDGIEWALDPDMVPFKHRSPLQQEIALRLAEWIDGEEATT